MITMPSKLRASGNQFRIITTSLAVVFASHFAVARADQVNLASFCRSTQSDDCISVSRCGLVYSFIERRPIGNAAVYETPNGVVAKFENDYFCAHSDSRISMSYLDCTSNGWQLTTESMNLTDPWNPTDLWNPTD
jgi:hypothetical protein